MEITDSFKKEFDRVLAAQVKAMEYRIERINRLRKKIQDEKNSPKTIDELRAELPDICVATQEPPKDWTPPTRHEMFSDEIV